MMELLAEGKDMEPHVSHGDAELLYEKRIIKVFGIMGIILSYCQHRK